MKYIIFISIYIVPFYLFAQIHAIGLQQTINISPSIHVSYNYTLTTETPSLTPKASLAILVPIVYTYKHDKVKITAKLGFGNTGLRFIEQTPCTFYDWGLLEGTECSNPTIENLFASFFVMYQGAADVQYKVFEKNNHSLHLGVGAQNYFMKKNFANTFTSGYLYTTGEDVYFSTELLLPQKGWMFTPSLHSSYSFQFAHRWNLLVDAQLNILTPTYLEKDNAFEFIGTFDDVITGGFRMTIPRAAFSIGLQYLFMKPDTK